MTRRTKRIDEHKQHRLTDFFSRLLSCILWAGIFAIVLIILSPLLLLPGSSHKNHEKPLRSQSSLTDWQPSKPNSTTFNTFRRSQLFKLVETPTPSQTQCLKMGLHWPDLELLKRYYTQEPTNPNDQNAKNTGRRAENYSPTSQPSLRQHLNRGGKPSNE